MESSDQGSAALEQFCLLAKSLKGRAVVGIIQQTLNSKKVYVFGELLSMPNVQALRETEHVRAPRREAGGARERGSEAGATAAPGVLKIKETEPAPSHA